MTFFSSNNLKNIFAITILLVLFLSIMPTSIFATVVINEIYPKTEQVTHTWIELYNNSNEPVSLDRWTLKNSNGTATTFTMNASSIIQPRNFLVFNYSQTNIQLEKNGDTVLLHNEKNDLIDSQSYPSILGYNSSVGRSTDGAGFWTFCDQATQERSNNCPPPTPTPLITPSPTALPTQNLSMYATDITRSPTLTDVVIHIEPTIFIVQHTATQSALTQHIDKRLLMIPIILIVITWITALRLIYNRKKHSS
jgi:hypothetical protein